MANPIFGSLQVLYSYPSDVGRTIELVTNIKGAEQFSVGPTDLQDITIALTSYINSGIVYAKVKVSLGSDIVDESEFSTFQGSDIDFSARVFFFDQFVSVSVNDRWVYSYAFALAAYDKNGTTASLRVDGDTTTITKIRRVELSDGREAIFVDYETTTDNAIQSIIQQRPIQVYSSVDRGLAFTYDAERDTVPASFVVSFSENVTRPGGISSDGLVYANDVGVSIDLETAKNIGLITRLYRLSELTSGYERAASAMQKQARQRRNSFSITQRLDPRLEVGDVLHVSKTLSSTNRVVDEYVIIEDVSISMSDGDYSMNLRGRKR